MNSPAIPKDKSEFSFQKGDVLGGVYDIHGLLGRGGFGEVFLAYNRNTEAFCALKTFHAELLANVAARNAFKSEALLWVNLDSHPFILAARLAREFAGRLFVQMDIVLPDTRGRVTLAHHLATARGPLDARQTLTWALQFCRGMEHALAHGIKCHRDIKPANILITEEGMLKISDFGLATATEAAWRQMAGQSRSLTGGGSKDGFSFSLHQAGEKVRCGTPGYMAPEVYRCEGADVRSDIYSFGLVLWQMASGLAIPPFVSQYRGDMEEFLQETYQQQVSGRLPRADDLLDPIIERCLRPNPAKRWANFGELCEVLDPLYQQVMGKKLEIPQSATNEPAFWLNKGISLSNLGRHEEALKCQDRALSMNPEFAAAWNSKGTSLNQLGRVAEAIECFDRALAINPRFSLPWSNKAGSLKTLKREGEALRCYDQALAIEPGNPQTWYNKGVMLGEMRRWADAIGCYDQALALDPRYAEAMNNKGNALRGLGRHEEAMACYEGALALDPHYMDAIFSKGGLLATNGRHEEALKCYRQALSIDPKNADIWFRGAHSLATLRRPKEALECYDRVLALDPRHINAWITKGTSLAALGRRQEAIACYDGALAVDPQSTEAWYNKGVSLGALERDQEAIVCYEQTLKIAPKHIKALNNKGCALQMLGRHKDALSCFEQALAIDPKFANASFKKAFTLDTLGRRREAIQAYQKFLELPPPLDPPLVAHSRKRLAEL